MWPDLLKSPKDEWKDKNRVWWSQKFDDEVDWLYDEWHDGNISERADRVLRRIYQLYCWVGRKSMEWQGR